MRIKTLIEKAAKAGMTVSVDNGHTTISKGRKSITIWQDGTILRNDISCDLCLKMRVYEALHYLKLD